MKHTLSLAAALFLATLTSSMAFAASGQYACTDTCDTDQDSNDCVGNPTPGEIAAALNSLKCDTTKPISVSPSQGTQLTNVCCVQK